MVSITISQKINFTLLISTPTFNNDTECLNGVRYLKGAKNEMLRRICDYKILGGKIILLNIQYPDIERAITILNT